MYDYAFPSSLPASVVEELKENGSVVCHNKWGHVVISLKDYQPQPQSLFARFFALFTRTPDLKPDLQSVQLKATQENIRTRNMLKKKRENIENFVVSTWQE